MLFLSSGWYADKGSRFLDTTARAKGAVVALKRERSARGFAMDHPVVRFTPLGQSEAVEFKSRFGLWPSPFSIGETVEVAYDAADPHRAEINSFWTIRFVPLLMAVFGLACLAAGLHTLRSTGRR